LRKTSLHPVGPATAEAFRKNIERLLGLYHPSVTSVMLNLLSSHDMARFLTLGRGDVSALRLATLFQMTYPGASSVYYGDEIGMTGGHDPANRGAFPWQRSETWDSGLLHEFQRLIALRRGRASLRRGTFQFLLAAGGVIAFARRLDAEVTIVIINTSTVERRVDLPTGGVCPDGAILSECWAHETVEVRQNLLCSLSIQPRSGRVFALG
jgi:neopullulanase